GPGRRPLLDRVRRHQRELRGALPADRRLQDRQDRIACGLPWRAAMRAPAMRRALSILVLALGAAAELLAGGHAEHAAAAVALSPDAIQLELPELGDHRYGPGVLRIPEAQNLRRLILHIPLRAVHQVLPKINTIGTGMVQTLRERQDEVVCDIDLA